MGNQSFDWFFLDICAIISSCRQKRMRLFCKVQILVFEFLESLEYHVGSKDDKKQVELRRCIVSDADLVLNIYFLDEETQVLH